MKYLLLHPQSFDRSAIDPALAAETVGAAVVHTPEELEPGEGRPTALLLDAASRELFTKTQLRRFVTAGGSLVILGEEGEDDLPGQVPEELMSAYVPAPCHPRHLLIALRSAFRDALARADNVRLRQETATRTRELAELTEIGQALSTERDYKELLNLILRKARELTGSDAGSLYLVVKPDDDAIEDRKSLAGVHPRPGDPPEDAAFHGKKLRFTAAQNFSRPNIPFLEFEFDIDQSSVAGYVVSTNEPLRIDDAYFLAPDVEYSFNRSMDEKHGYRTKSVLTIPMTDHVGEVIGALQLINRKRDFHETLGTPEDFDREVIPYSPRITDLAKALAGQAAVSIENSQLYEQIEKMFEKFVYASVKAIEQRDPATEGHSQRVADGTVALAKTVDRADVGPYRTLSFTSDQIREIKYAGLLHDFGKVGVRENVLVKKNKLYDEDLALIKQRYAFIHRTAERDFLQRRVAYLEQHGKKGYEAFVEHLEEEHRQRLAALGHFLRLVEETNQPKVVLTEQSFDELLKFSEAFYEDLEGVEQPYLQPREVNLLTIRKGSLNDDERRQIEDHVTHTYRFLQKIQWTDDLKGIPAIAYGHHEKLNGRGYPRGIAGDEILPQTKMMTIADIFDALVASDRPYKPALSQERALDILSDEVEGGLLDRELFRLFTEARVFDLWKPDGDA